MAEVTRPDLDEIEARWRRTTKGTWLASCEDMTWSRDGLELGAVQGFVSLAEQTANTKFVAHSHQDIPALLAYCRELEALTDWRHVSELEDHSEPVVYARKNSVSKWNVGLAYWTVSQKWNPEAESQQCPKGFTWWKSLGTEPPK